MNIKKTSKMDHFLTTKKHEKKNENLPKSKTKKLIIIIKILKNKNSEKCDQK